MCILVEYGEYMGEVLTFTPKVETSDQTVVFKNLKVLRIIDDIKNSGEPWAQADADTALSLMRRAAISKE